MDSRLKIAAQKLLDVAERLDKEASENSYFVCDDCFHTSSLSDINRVRKEASVSNNVKRVSPVTVNDKVACLECGGLMSYVATEESKKYYIEEDEVESPEEEVGGEEESPIEDSEDPELDAIEEESEDIPEPEEDAPELGGDEVIEEDATPVEDYDSEGIQEGEVEDTEDNSEQEEPLDEPLYEPVGEEPETEEEEEESLEEFVEEEPKKKKKVDVKIPRKDSPKFEKMPKTAEDEFWAAVRKYTV